VGIAAKIEISVVMITFHVKTVDIMTVRTLKSVSGVVAVEMEMENGRLTDLMESASPEMKISVVTITVHVNTVDIMTVRSLKSVSGVVGVEMEMINGVLKDLMESASQEMRISVVMITFHVKTVDIMTVRSLKSVSGVVAVEMENGVLKDLMESVNPKILTVFVRGGMMDAGGEGHVIYTAMLTALIKNKLLQTSVHPLWHVIIG